MQLLDRDLLRRCIGPDGLDISGRELARRAGLGQAIVGHLLCGRRTTCSRRTATRIEQAIGCPPGLLFDEAVPVPVPASAPVPPRSVPGDQLAESRAAGLLPAR